MGIIVVVIVIILIVLIISVVVSQSNETDRRETAIASLRDFSVSQVVEDEVASFYFAVDESRQEVFCYSKGSTIRFKYQDIITAEIKVDDETIVSKKSASLGGALAGGLIAGGLGAVVGGSSLGKSTSKRMVNAVNVHIVLRNSIENSFDVRCLAIESKSDSILYVNASRNAQMIFDILRIVMDTVQSSKTESAIVQSNIEELTKIAELKQQGLITDEEFTVLKARILSK